MTTTPNAGSATGIDLDALLDKLARVSRWIDKFPVPTDGATAMLCHIRDVQEALARATPQHPKAPAAAVRAAERIDAMHKGVVGVFAAIKAEHDAATPQHSVIEQAGIDMDRLRELAEAYRYAPLVFKTGERAHTDIALDAIAEFIAGAHPVGSGLLNTDELAALRRFDECAQDGEGYDVPQEMMQRLAEIGVVRRKSGRFYEATDFGRRVLGQPLASTAATQPEQASIKTWKERCGDTVPTPSLNQALRAMKAEIADLRAALAIPASTAPTQQENEQANVLPPFAAPAGQHDPMMSVLTESRVIELFDHEFGGQDFAVADSEIMAFALSIEDEVLKQLQSRRFRAQGGNTNADSFPASTAASERQASVSALPPLPAQHEELRARWKCEDCDGTGEVGEPMDQGYFQPPERARCSTCDGAGQVPIAAYTDDQMRDYALDALSGRATIPSEADERAAMLLALDALGVATTPLPEDRQTVLKAQAALRAALTHRATTATHGYNDPLDIFKYTNDRAIEGMRKTCSMFAAAPGAATTAADQQGEQNSSSNISSKSGVAADQQGDTASASGIERFTLYHDHGRSNMMGDDDGEYVLYSHHVATLAQQGAAQAQAGEDAACWREVVKRIGYREAEDGPQWVIDLPKPTRWGNTDANFIAAVRAAMAAPATGSNA